MSDAVPEGLPAPVARFVQAINGGDTDAFVATFTETGFVDDWGRVLSGPVGVRSWAQSDAIGADARMTVLDAMIEVGGLTPQAAGNRAKIVRWENGTQVDIPVRLHDLLNKGKIDANVLLRPGDVLIIPESVF